MKKAHIERSFLEWLKIVSWNTYNRSKHSKYPGQPQTPARFYRGNMPRKFVVRKNILAKATSECKETTITLKFGAN